MFFPNGIEVPKCWETQALDTTIMFLVHQPELVAHVEGSPVQDRWLQPWFSHIISTLPLIGLQKDTSEVSTLFGAHCFFACTKVSEFTYPVTAANVCTQICSIRLQRKCTWQETMTNFHVMDGQNVILWPNFVPSIQHHGTSNTWTWRGEVAIWTPSPNIKTSMSVQFTAVSALPAYGIAVQHPCCFAPTPLRKTHSWIPMGQKGVAPSQIANLLCLTTIAGWEKNPSSFQVGPVASIPSSQSPYPTRPRRSIRRHGRWHGGRRRWMGGVPGSASQHIRRSVQYAMKSPELRQVMLTDLQQVSHDSQDSTETLANVKSESST